MNDNVIPFRPKKAFPAVGAPKNTHVDPNYLAKNLNWDQVEEVLMIMVYKNGEAFPTPTIGVVGSDGLSVAHANIILDQTKEFLVQKSRGTTGNSPVGY